MEWLSGTPIKSIAACISIAIIILLANFLQLYDGNIQTTRYPVQINVKKAEMPPLQTSESTPIVTSKPEEIDNSTIMILFWRPPFGVKKTYLYDKQLCGDCEYTYDTKYFEESEAVIIHYSEATPSNSPKTRKSSQMFIFFSMESPYALNVLRGMRFNSMDSYFNWTMSYRRDSHIFFPYVEWNKENGVFNGDTKSQYSPDRVNNIISKKQGDPYILWMTGNCGSTHGANLRKQIVSEMESFGLKIDKRGGCFGMPVPRDEQYLSFAEKFKFYLSFENALHCRDYITEKLWINALEAGVVPIVWGPKREDIIEIAPAGSYIFYEDFSSTKELVDYIQYLNSNTTAYAEYFNWRLKPAKDYKYRDNGDKFERNAGMCQLCRKLWTQRRFQNLSNVITSLDDWWSGSERSECLSRTVTLH